VIVRCHSRVSLWNNYTQTDQVKTMAESAADAAHSVATSTLLKILATVSKQAASNFESQLLEARLEVQQLHGTLAAQRSRISQLLREIADLDENIALFVRNRITVEEIVSSSRLFAAKSGAIEMHALEPLFSKMFTILHAHGNYIRRAAPLISVQDRNIFLHIVMRCIFGDEFDLHHEYALLRVIQSLIGDDMIACCNVANFMRGSSFISAVLTAYCCRPRLHRFLTDTLGHLVQDIASANEDLEIDASRIRHFALDAVASSYRLRRISEISLSVIRALRCSLRTLPPGVRWICRTLNEHARNKFANVSKSITNSIVLLFLFSSWVIPVLNAPAQHGLLDSEPHSNTKRTLSLVCKFLFRLCEGSYFSDSESYLKPLNDDLVLLQGELEPIVAFVVAPSRLESLLLSGSANHNWSYESVISMRDARWFLSLLSPNLDSLCVDGDPLDLRAVVASLSMSLDPIVTGAAPITSNPLLRLRIGAGLRHLNLSGDGFSSSGLPSGSSVRAFDGGFAGSSALRWSYHAARSRLVDIFQALTSDGAFYECARGLLEKWESEHGELVLSPGHFMNDLVADEELNLILDADDGSTDDPSTTAGSSAPKTDVRMFAPSFSQGEDWGCLGVLFQHVIGAQASFSEDLSFVWKQFSKLALQGFFRRCQTSADVAQEICHDMLIYVQGRPEELAAVRVEADSAKSLIAQATAEEKMLELRIAAYGHYLQNAKSAAVAPTTQKKSASSALSALFQWNLPRNPFRRFGGHSVRLNWRQVQQKGLYVSSSLKPDSLHLLAMKIRTDAANGDYIMTVKIGGQKIIEHPVVFEQLLLMQNRGETRLLLPGFDFVLDLSATLSVLNKKFISKCACHFVHDACAFASPYALTRGRRGLHVPAASSSRPSHDDDGLQSGGLYSTGGGMSSASSMTSVHAFSVIPSLLRLQRSERFLTRAQVAHVVKHGNQSQRAL
jgi:hypothetical protein